MAQLMVKAGVTVQTELAPLDTLLPTPWEALVFKNNTIAIEQAAEMYNTHVDAAMAHVIPVEQQQLDQWHKQHYAGGRQFLRARLIGGQQSQEMFLALYEVLFFMCGLVCAVLRSTCTEENCGV